MKYSEKSIPPTFPVDDIMPRSNKSQCQYQLIETPYIDVEKFLWYDYQESYPNNHTYEFENIKEDVKSDSITKWVRNMNINY